MADCFVCAKQAGRIVAPGGALYDDDLVYASHGVLGSDGKPIPLGTLFVEPKRHVPGIGDLTRPEAERVGWLTSRLAAALQATERAEHVYVHVLGHHVPHLHVWLVPRYPGTPPEYLPFRPGAWPGAPRGGVDEITALCDRVRAELRRAQPTA